MSRSLRSFSPAWLLGARPVVYLTAIWRDLTVGVRRLFAGMVALGAVALVIGILLDLRENGWGDFSFTVNIASSATAALFGIPLALTILSRVGRKQAEQLRDREVMDLARNSFDLLSRAVLSLTERGNLVGPGEDEVCTAELDALNSLEGLRNEIVTEVLPLLEAYYFRVGGAVNEEGKSRGLRIVSPDRSSIYESSLDVLQASERAQASVIRAARRWMQVVDFEDSDVFWRIVQYYWQILEADVRPRLIGSNQYWASPILASAMPYLTALPRNVLSRSGPYWPVLLFPLGYSEEAVAEPFKYFHPLGSTRPTMDDAMPLLAATGDRIAAVHDTFTSSVEYLDRLRCLIISVRNMRSECIGAGEASLSLPSDMIKEVSCNILS